MSTRNSTPEREVAIMWRCSREEREAVKKLAEEADMTVVNYLRLKVLGLAPQNIPPGRRPKAQPETLPLAM